MVVPHYNYGRYLPVAVESVLAQDGVDVDVIIVDDASTDGSLEVARRLAATDDRIALVEHEVHQRHIRTAVGRDYADVPPTHGVFRGKTSSELYVAVHVEAKESAPALDRKMPIPEDWSVLVERAQQPPETPAPLIDLQQMQQQQ